MSPAITSAQIRAKLAPYQTKRQRLDETIPRLEDEVRGLRLALVDVHVAAATAPGANGEDRAVAEVERKLAKAERELAEAQREREVQVKVIRQLEREHATAQTNEILVDARRENREDLRRLVDACVIIGDVIQRNSQRRLAAQAVGISHVDAFGVPPFPHDRGADLEGAVRSTLIRAATDRDVDRGDVEFEGDEFMVWRPKGAKR